MTAEPSSEVGSTQAFILAGGQGERLHPLTASRPKPAVSFGGVFRIIDFTLANCTHSGVHHVSLVTQYRHEELHRYVRERWGHNWNRAEGELRFLPPTSGKRYLGTADAVFQNLELVEAVRTDFVLVLSGDHIYDMDYGALLRQHAESDADFTIATVEHPIKEASRFGIVEVDRTWEVTSFEEKPFHPRPLPSSPSLALVNMGVYAFKRSVLVDVLQQHCATGSYDFGRDIIHRSYVPGERTHMTSGITAPTCLATGGISEQSTHITKRVWICLPPP